MPALCISRRVPLQAALHRLRYPQWLSRRGRDRAAAVPLQRNNLVRSLIDGPDTGDPTAWLVGDIRLRIRHDIPEEMAAVFTDVGSARGIPDLYQIEHVHF